MYLHTFDANYQISQKNVFWDNFFSHKNCGCKFFMRNVKSGQSLTLPCLILSLLRNLPADAKMTKKNVTQKRIRSEIEQPFSVLSR